MQKYDIHVCLVSTQAAANLLPVLDTDFKPREVLLVVSQDMEEEANALTLVFEAQGVNVRYQNITSVSDFGYLENTFESICKENKDKNIALNATGGNKAMVIAANNMFRNITRLFFIWKQEIIEFHFFTNLMKEITFLILV